MLQNMAKHPCNLLVSQQNDEENGAPIVNLKSDHQQNVVGLVHGESEVCSVPRVQGPVGRHHHAPIRKGQVIILQVLTGILRP